MITCHFFLLSLLMVDAQTSRGVKFLARYPFFTVAVIILQIIDMHPSMEGPSWQKNSSGGYVFLSEFLS